MPPFEMELFIYSAEEAALRFEERERERERERRKKRHTHRRTNDKNDFDENKRNNDDDDDGFQSLLCGRGGQHAPSVDRHRSDHADVRGCIFLQHISPL